MKYLENEQLTELTAQLSDAVVGQSHRVIHGRIEAYSMKRAGSDKKFAHALGQRYVAEMEEIEQELAETVGRRASDSRKRSSSAATWNEAVTAKKQCIRPRSQSFDYTLDSANSKTTLGDFSELGTRRLMTDLILTLNASFPDYDFANVKPRQFEKLEIQTVRDRIYERLSELAAFKPENWLIELWTAVNHAIDLRECDVYSFEEEDLKDNSLWNFNYFFVNKSLKRILIFTCLEKIDEISQQEVAEDTMNFYSSDAAQTVDDCDWDPSTADASVPISAV
jgi:hypothetical protein